MDTPTVRLTWSATFDSYDQYRDLVYYLVTLHADGSTVGEPFMVLSALEWGTTVKDWSSAEFNDLLRAALARVAATGKTNTTYSR